MCTLHRKRGRLYVLAIVIMWHILAILYIDVDIWFELASEERMEGMVA